MLTQKKNQFDRFLDYMDYQGKAPSLKYISGAVILNISDNTSLGTL